MQRETPSKRLRQKSTAGKQIVRCSFERSDRTRGWKSPRWDTDIKLRAPILYILCVSLAEFKFVSCVVTQAKVTNYNRRIFKAVTATM